MSDVEQAKRGGDSRRHPARDYCGLILKVNQYHCLYLPRSVSAAPMPSSAATAFIAVHSVGQVGQVGQVGRISVHARRRVGCGGAGPG